MIIIDLNYLAPLEKIDGAMGEHVRFLNKYYKEKTFVASGRKIPRTGGIILAVGKSKSEVEQIMKDDPFCKLGLADVTITEFQTSQCQPELRKVLG